MPNSDANIIKDLNICDKTFEQIYKTYFNQLYVYAQKIVKDKETAEDIVHDFFTMLWKMRETVQIRSSLKSYLYKGIRNRCLKHLKHIIVKRKHSEYALLVANIIDDSNNPMYELLARETEKEIELVMSTLPAQQREILEMSILEESSYEEIANKIGIPIGSVGPQINRAKKKIWKLLINR